MISGSSLSSGTTSSTKRGTVGGGGGANGVIAAFLALEKNLMAQKKIIYMIMFIIKCSLLLFTCYTYPFFFPFSGSVSFSFSTESSLGTDGSFFSSSCSLRVADFFSTSNSESGSVTTTSSSGMVSKRVRGVAPAWILKVSWNWTGMLSLKNIMSVLAFCEPKVLWVSFRQGALSTVPSTRET